MLRASALIFTALFSLASDRANAQYEDYPVYSAERAGTPQFKNCIATAQANTEVGKCLQDELKRQNDLLELTLAEFISSATADHKKQIEAAQLAWKSFREENCKVRLHSGGSGSGLFYQSCLVRETITRRTEIAEVWDY